jgi:hypothetical protein
MQTAVLFAQGSRFYCKYTTNEKIIITAKAFAYRSKGVAQEELKGNAVSRPFLGWREKSTDPAAGALSKRF